MPDFTLYAIEIAQQVGAVLRDAQQQKTQIQVDKKGRNDLVTQIDRQADKMIHDLILEKYPEHGILAEESGEHKSTSPYCWIVDPLDGTTNFAHGIPMFAISIALKYETELIAAVVYNPMSNELYSAEKSAGAYLNGKAIHISNTQSLAE